MARTLNIYLSNTIDGEYAKVAENVEFNHLQGVMAGFSAGEYWVRISIEDNGIEGPLSDPEKFTVLATPKITKVQFTDVSRFTLEGVDLAKYAVGDLVEDLTLFYVENGITSVDNTIVKVTDTVIESTLLTADKTTAYWFEYKDSNSSVTSAVFDVPQNIDGTSEDRNGYSVFNTVITYTGLAYNGEDSPVLVEFTVPQGISYVVQVNGKAVAYEENERTKDAVSVQIPIEQFKVTEGNAIQVLSLQGPYTEASEVVVFTPQRKPYNPVILSVTSYGEEVTYTYEEDSSVHHTSVSITNLLTGEESIVLAKPDNGKGTFTVDTAGNYVLTVEVFNSVGNAQDTAFFKVFGDVTDVSITDEMRVNSTDELETYVNASWTEQDSCWTLVEYYDADEDVWKAVGNYTVDSIVLPYFSGDRLFRFSYNDGNFVGKPNTEFFYEATQLDTPVLDVVATGNKTIVIDWEIDLDAHMYEVIRNGYTIGTTTDTKWFTDLSDFVVDLYQVVAHRGYSSVGSGITTEKEVETEVEHVTVPSQPLNVGASAQTCLVYITIKNTDSSIKTVTAKTEVTAHTGNYSILHVLIK